MSARVPDPAKAWFHCPEGAGGLGGWPVRWPGYLTLVLALPLPAWLGASLHHYAEQGHRPLLALASYAAPLVGLPALFALMRLKGAPPPPR